MDDDYDEYRRWDGDVDIEVCFMTITFLLSTIIFVYILFH